MSDAPRRSFDPALVDAHPLLRRLSGEVVWLLLEERGVDQAAIGEFMDRWGPRMRKTLAALRLAAPGASGGMRVTAGPGGAGCPRCAALEGLVLPAGHPSLAALCPPYALNCPMGLDVLEPGHPDLARALAMDDPGPASPHGELLCPLAPQGGHWPA